MRRLVVLTLVIGLLVSCAAPATNAPQTTATPAGPTLNMVKAAGLRETTRIEILQMRALPGVATRQRTITDGQSISRLIASLDAAAPFQPRSSCAFIYRLTFHLSNGRTEEFGFSCGDEGQILRGGQDYWQEMDILAPPEFQEMIKELIK